jgi:hypothetical protein
MELNEYIARKLGEVLAFAEVGLETFEKAEDALKKVFGKEKYEEAKKENSLHAEKIKSIVEQYQSSEITLSKAQKTGEKLRFMRDHYIGDEWDDAAELAEWMGFFEGAAIVHWYLVKGASEKLGIKVLEEVCTNGINFHRSLFDKDSISIENIGKEKA